MNGFRNFILGMIDALQLLLIVAVTVSGGIIGASYTVFISYASGRAGEGAFLGFLIGALIGFVTSATAAAISLSLAQIVHNTGHALAILAKAYPQAEAQISNEIVAEAGVRAPYQRSNSSERFVQADKELTVRSVAVLKRAKLEGYTIEMEAPSEICVRGENLFVRFTNNHQIETFGDKRGW